jgi:hypothetical protein
MKSTESIRYAEQPEGFFSSCFPSAKMNPEITPHNENSSKNLRNSSKSIHTSSKESSSESTPAASKDLLSRNKRKQNRPILVAPAHIEERIEPSDTFFSKIMNALIRKRGRRRTKDRKGMNFHGSSGSLEALPPSFTRECNAHAVRRKSISMNILSTSSDEPIPKSTLARAKMRRKWRKKKVGSYYPRLKTIIEEVVL